MCYSRITIHEAIDIIEKLKSNTIIKNIFSHNESEPIMINKEEAVELINNASSVYFNDDECVRSMDLFFGKTNDVSDLVLSDGDIKLLFSN